MNSEKEAVCLSGAVQWAACQAAAGPCQAKVKRKNSEKEAVCLGSATPEPPAAVTEFSKATVAEFLLPAVTGLILTAVIKFP